MTPNTPSGKPSEEAKTELVLSVSREIIEPLISLIAYVRTCEKTNEALKAEIERLKNFVDFQTLGQCMKCGICGVIGISGDEKGMLVKCLVCEKDKEISTLKAQVKERDDEIAHLTRDSLIYREMGLLTQIESLKYKLEKAREALKDIQLHSKAPFGDWKWMNYINQVAKEVLEQIGEDGE